MTSVKKPSHSGRNQSFTSGYLTGQVLVSTPAMTDTRFFQSVVYVCGHDDNGAMGFIINKPLPSILFSDLLNQLNINHPVHLTELPIYYGGPVEIGRGFVLHSPDYTHSATVGINQDFSITATLEILRDIAHNQGPHQCALMLGYTGWSSGQLEEELQENQWVVLSGEKEFVFDSPPENMWMEAYDQLGINPGHMSIDSGHA